MNRASSATGWVRNPDGTLGWTWNPITGCLNGCPYCYARKLANGRLKSRYLANDNYAPIYPNIEGTTIRARELQPFYPRFWKDRLYHAWGGEPKGIFVCDMSDLFGIGIPEEWTAKVLNLCRLHNENRYYLLTKQPQNLIKFSPFPDNCWVGVTATDTKMFHNACFYLSEIEVPVKYISIEPFLDWEDDGYQRGRMKASGIKWVIIGAQTKPYKPPTIEAVQEIVQACDKAGIPAFLKDNLKPLLQQNNHNIYSFPEWAGKQFAVTGDYSLAPTNPHLNEPMRLLRQELPVER